MVCDDMEPPNKAMSFLLAFRASLTDEMMLLITKQLLAFTAKFVDTIVLSCTDQIPVTPTSKFGDQTRLLLTETPLAMTIAVWTLMKESSVRSTISLATTNKCSQEMLQS
jgi:hypothetical protein